MKLKGKLKQTCHACPSQWEGYTKDNKPIYIRYRWGYLSIRVGDKDKDISNAIDSDEIYGEQLGRGLDGDIGEDKVLDIIKNL